MSEDLHQLISDYLSTQRLMALATYADAEPWIANVYFIHDEQLNLYFLSKKSREHSLAIVENPKVAVAIADSHQTFQKHKKGLQLSGTAKKVNPIEQLKWMLRMWKKLNVKDAEAKNDDAKNANPKQFIDAGTASVYRITPKRIKLVDTERWPEEQAKVLEL